MPRVVSPNHSAWVNLHDLPLSPRIIGHELLLVFGTALLNDPLWSPRWEMIFSLLLPLYLLYLRTWPTLVWPKAAALLVAIGVGVQLDSLALLYLPVNGLGCCRPCITAETDLAPSPGRRWPAALAAAFGVRHRKWGLPDSEVLLAPPRGGLDDAVPLRCASDREQGGPPSVHR